jgi:CBS domain-containing protein
MSDDQDEYAESLETEFRKLEDALLGDTVRLLAPSEPLKLSADATVHDAIVKMVANRRAAVVVVDGAGRLTGIFTERDVLTRIVGQDRDPKQTRLADVMTAEPEALTPDDRVCHAINRMHNAGYRTVPLVDADHRPIGIVTVNDVVRWLAEIFPDAVLHLPPGDRLKNPLQMDAG